MFITRTHGFLDISRKRDFWKELANELNGTFKITHTVSKDLTMLSLVIPYKSYQIEFTESDTHPLKVRCVLSATQSFDFMLSWEDTIEKLLKLFGQRDIEIGDTIFDDKYIIESSNSIMLKALLSNEMKEIMLSNNIFSYSCKFQKKDDTLLLSSLISRSVNSKDELSEIYKLCCLTIDKLIEFKIIEKKS